MIGEESFDYEDSFLISFVGITMLLGLLASWLNYDVKTLWVALGISYLLLYRKRQINGVESYMDT
jgi:hypothetical protein